MIVDKLLSHKAFEDTKQINISLVGYDLQSLEVYHFNTRKEVIYKFGGYIVLYWKTRELCKEITILVTP